MNITNDDAHDGPYLAGVPAGKAVFCVCVFFALMILFNGVAMYESAYRLEYGKTHDFWVAVLRPVEWVSRASGFSRVRVQAEKTVGLWLNKKD
jgi:hypothetical protein